MASSPVTRSMWKHFSLFHCDKWTVERAGEYWKVTNNRSHEIIVNDKTTADAICILNNEPPIIVITETFPILNRIARWLTGYTGPRAEAYRYTGNAIPLRHQYAGELARH